MFPEEMARLRCRRLLEEAEEARLARRLKAVRFWRRVSAFAARRAERRLPRN
ncbi:muconolactone delta-isomerase [Actinopolyspora biskrensis]|uniref:Muconolactone delta-isomerase n=1 Tax=Actinopolyspora biskrensis TaxID=1470178 RepID=A0A852Z0L1_9ACTN|nr:muconolactone delta-isomerase [Actinopolyspora biskrensis]